MMERRTAMLSALNKIFNYSVRVGRLFGIPISLHITLIFFLLPALRGRSLGLWYTLEWIFLVVLSILLHELGHALTAKRYRLHDISIMLHGFGGYAASSGRTTPKQSLIITLMGPAVTFALGFLCLAVGFYGGNSAIPGTAMWMQLNLIESLGRLNLLLGVLNMLPSLPFDGGLALAAILNRKMPEHKAMRAVGHLGLIVSPALLLFGLITSQGFLTIFGLMGVLGCVTYLLQSGGIRMGEFFADRRDRKEMEVVKQREAARTQEYLGDVHSRQREREEKERLRKLLGE